ncbi:MAG TPA: LD-carboxypeptidase, partial [Polyangiales bacterium]|nr:LD-carboxypeptidase [Polyangiales bacterium]
MSSFTLPAPLSTGAEVRVVAASSPFDLERYARGVELLRARYAVSEGPALFAKHGFLAGEDEMRLRDLHAALRDEHVRAIVPPRGGYGATRLLPSLDVDAVRRQGKWLVGFSDVTALHAVWARAGLCSLHGPMVCSLPEASAELQRAWFTLLEGGAPPPLTELTQVVGGRAEGRLFGGNLSVLAALVGTPYFPDLTDTVLALEDVGERPYRLDRMLTTMLQAGVLRGVRAVLLGQFTKGEPGAAGVSADDVLAEQLGVL